jgi:lactoylglutathione lyase
MVFNMCVNLYVKDVEEEVKFFKSIGFLEIERHKMENSDSVVIAPLTDGNAFLQIWDIEFIKKVSPEVANDKASLLFTVNNIEEMHEKLKNLTDTTGDLMEANGKKAFNFQSPSGNYYAFMAV